MKIFTKEFWNEKMPEYYRFEKEVFKMSTEELKLKTMAKLLDGGSLFGPDWQCELLSKELWKRGDGIGNYK